MSDRHFSHEVWLSKLRDHLTEERYAARTSRQCIAVARHFLRCLDKRKVDVITAQPASVEDYLQQARRTAAMAIRQITKAGSVSTPMASTCSCAWFRASGHQHRKPSRLSRFCKASCAESTPNGWPASAASLRELCLIAVARQGAFSIGWGNEQPERNLRPSPISTWTAI